jgi:hypothetical protein
MPPDVNQQAGFSWDSGGTSIYVKRAYPMNTAAGSTFDVYMTQVPKNAAGQVLRVRHFDNDNGGHATINYYLGKNLAACKALAATAATSNADCIRVAQGNLSGQDEWYGADGDADSIALPAKGTGNFATAFGAQDSAVLMARYPTGSQDTSIWELIYVRPRLIE